MQSRIKLLDSFIPVPPAVKKVQNATVMEGRDLTKECKVTTGTPPVTVFWKVESWKVEI